MDTSDPEISFDAEGVCNHCQQYRKRAKTDLFPGAMGRKLLDEIVARIKQDGRGRDYDCIIGLSGGVDSSYVALSVKRLGLRPLAIHLDNGWNSELAVSNIQKIVQKLDIDLHTVVLDWQQFRDLQVAFLRAGVANLEIPTDHVIVSTLFEQASAKGLRYLISGGNVTSEAIMPDAWGYDPKDWRHIKAIYKRFQGRRLKDFPHMTLLHWAHYIFVKRITFFPILNYLDFDKEKAKQELVSEFGWRDYGGKHYESIFTRYFQGYILIRKFGFDKRRAFYSTLVNAGQITREQALIEMTTPAYSKEMMEEDRGFVIKKLGLTEAEFEEIMNAPPRSFADYPNNRHWFERFAWLAARGRMIATLRPGAAPPDTV
jgi:N-acetyl sugar amidotransferase